MLANEGRVFIVELHVWHVILHCLEPRAKFLRFVSILRKPKAILKSFCSVQMSQKSLEKNELAPNECLLNFYLKFDFLERPKN